MAASEDEFGDFDIDDDDLIPLDSYRPFQPAGQAVPQPSQTTTGYSERHAQPPKTTKVETHPTAAVLQSDAGYGDIGLDEEDVVDLDALEHNVIRNGDPSATEGTRSRLVAPGLETNPAVGQYDVRDVEMASNEEAAIPQDSANLRAQVEELERQLQHAQAAARHSSILAQTKSGEAAILRQKEETSSRGYKEQIAHMEQQHAEAMNNLKREIESLRKQQEKANTNNLFLENEVLEAAHRAKQTRAKRHAGDKSPFATPRKERKTLPFGDGFDDDELTMISPSKLKDRSKIATPKLGNKRKRAIADDSPSRPLTLSETLPAPDTTTIDPEVLGQLGINSEKHDLIQQILNHRVSNSPNRVIEELASHYLPGERKKRISSLVLDGLLSVSADSEISNLLPSFCRSLASVWATALKEQCFGPVHLLIDLAHFSLRLGLVALPIEVSLDILDVVMSSIDLVAIPIGRAATNEALPRTEEEKRIERYINVEACLSLLLSMAALHMSDVAVEQKFWSGMTYDFILLMLMRAQPLPQTLLMLRLLRASVLPSSFGALSMGDGKTRDRQARNENSIIDRLINLLLQAPNADAQGNPPCGPLDIANLRVETLGVLITIAGTDHGAQRLANHRTAIGRLFVFLSDCMNELHKCRSRTHSATADAVNLTVRTLFAVIDKYRDSIDMRQKLGVVTGGTHIHLVTLTRLTFSERLVLDEGIDPDVVELARSLLGTYVTLEEGTAIEAIYASPPSAPTRTVNSEMADQEAGPSTS